MPKAKASKQKKKQASPARPKASVVPVAISSSRTTNQPRVAGTTVLTRISHRELVGEIFAYDPNFHVQQFRVNPGLAGTFPWLSATANRYEMYRFQRLCFEYIPRVPTTQAGTITMAFDFDANDDLPVTRADMVSYLGATSSSVWEPMTMRFGAAELNRAYSERYTRLGQHSGLDLKTYDTGFVIVSVTGAEHVHVASLAPPPFVVVQTSSMGKPLSAAPSAVGAYQAPSLTTYDTYAVGELYVSYDIELMVPQKRVQVAEGAIQDLTATPVPVAHALESAYGSYHAGPLPVEVVKAGEHDYTGNLLRFLTKWAGRITLSAIGDASPTEGHDGLKFQSLVPQDLASGRVTSIQDVFFAEDSGHHSIGEQLIEAEPGALIQLATAGLATLTSLFVVLSSHRGHDYLEL